MANFSKSFNFRNGLQVDDDKLIVKPNTGLVGIGNTIPTQVLDVEGNIKSSGTVNATNVEVGTGITVGSGANQIKIDSGTGRVTAVEYIGDGSTLTNVVAIATAGFKELSGTLSTTSSVGIGSTNVGSGGVFPDFTLDVLGDVRVTGPSSFIGITTISDLFADTLSVSNSSTFAGGATINQANVTGVSTFTGISTSTSLIQANGLEVAGVSTFGDNVQFKDFVRFGKPHSEEDNVPGKFAVYNGNSLFPSAMVYTGGHLYIDPMTQVRFGKPSNYLRFYSQSIGTGAGRGQIQFGYSVGENGPKGLDIFGHGTLSMKVANKEAVGIGSTVADVSLSYDGDPKLTTNGIGVTIFNQLDTTNLNVSGTSTFNDAINANAGATLNQLNVTGVSTLTGRLTATEINSASSNVVRLLQGGTQVFNTIGAGVSVSNTLKIGSLNGGTSGLSALDATLIYGDESGANAFMTRESFNILNNDTGNFNYFLNINNLKDSGTDRTGDFVWHKASNALMTLTGIGGSLGIGVTTPSVALEVVGGATLGGTVNMPGNVAVGGSLTVDNFILGNLTGDITGNVTGNLTGNVTATDGESTIDTFLAPTQIGIGSTGTHPQLGPEPFFVNPGAGPIENAYKMVHINNEGRVGIGTSLITGGAGSVQRVDVHGETQIRDGSLLVGQKQIPSSAVDFSDVVNIPDQSSYAWAADRSRIAYMLPPKVTTAQRDQLYDGAANSGNGGGTVVAGALIYNTSTNRIELYNGSGWVGLGTVV